MASTSSSPPPPVYTTDPSSYTTHQALVGRRDSKEWNSFESNHFVVLIETLAKGSCAKVDLVRHVPTGFVCALKVYKPTKKQQADKELSIFRQVTTSPFLLHYYDCFTVDYSRQLVLQYAAFGSLDNLTRSLKGLGSDNLKLYAKEIGLALVFLHSKSIMHRDVKPENMLILSTGHVVLADFNLAYQAPHLVSNQMCGTHLTRPPEVWKGKLYDNSVDVWMYGISLFNIASNSWPYAHVFVDKQVAALNAGQPKFPNQFFSPDLVDLIQQTIEFEACDRIPSEFLVHHRYFNSVGDDDIPFQPSYLMSLVQSEKERQVIECILKHRSSTPSQNESSTNSPAHSNSPEASNQPTAFNTPPDSNLQTASNTAPSSNLQTASNTPPSSNLPTASNSTPGISNLPRASNIPTESDLQTALNRPHDSNPLKPPTK